MQSPLTETASSLALVTTATWAWRLILKNGDMNFMLRKWWQTKFGKKFLYLLSGHNNFWWLNTNFWHFIFWKFYFLRRLFAWPGFKSAINPPSETITGNRSVKYVNIYWSWSCKSHRKRPGFRSRSRLKNKILKVRGNQKTSFSFQFWFFHT